ncbi:MAG: hypothetical protein DYG88_17530 [Chloroflexi bacterium CFX4]|nr:hypothetical protein [Chloroflexi bacterium CFX4]MDL1924259.1 hypothetical protein [Chloroflexi bacterium CFX3]
MPSRLYLPLALAVLLLAAWLRLAELHRYPPALHYDEAADMLLGRDIAFYGYRPFPVVEAYSGREALFYYLSVPLLQTFGTDIFATRLTSAFLGILTVAVTLALGRAMFGRHPHGALIALSAAAWLAVNGAQVWLTRQGFRTSPQPLLEALSLWLLFVTLNRSQRWLLAAVLGGFFGGAALYTYMAARIFPLWLPLPLIALLILERRRSLRAQQIALFFGALLITALPLISFYLSKPDVFLDRLTQVADADSATPTLLESLRLHAEMFFLRGDPLLRYNLYPERPWFDPISGVLMVIGFGAAAWLFTRRQLAPTVRFAALCVALCPLLIAPSVVAVSGLPPSHMRSVAMVPLIFFAPALGIAYLLRRAPRLRMVALTALFPVLALNTWHDYTTWAKRADLFYDAHGDMQLIGQWLETHMQPDEMVYIASAFYNHATVLAHKVDHGQIRWLMAEHLILSPKNETALYIFPRTVDSLFSSALTVGFEESSTRLATPNGADGAPAFTAYRIRAAADRRVASGAYFADVLHGANLPFPYNGRGGESVQLLLAWDVLRTPDQADLTPIIALHDPFGEEIARFHPYFEQADRWRAGEGLLLTLSVPLPEGAPPGSYTLHAAWISKGSGTHVPIVDADNRFAGLWEQVGQINLAPSPPRSTPPQGTAVLPTLYAALTEAPKPTEQGDLLRFSLVWQATQAPNALPNLVLRAVPTQGTPITLWQGQPARNTYPFAEWRTGEYLIDRYAVPLPPDLPEGDYTLRLSLADQTVFEAPFTVIGVARRYTPPDLPPCNFRFGEQIALIGCEVTQAGDQVRVRLAWRTLASPSTAYTVTVQALNPDGTLYSQQDAPPSPRPTSRWLPDEIFESVYTLSAPPTATFSLIVALYTPNDGRRLPVRAEDALLGDAAPLPFTAR